MNPRLVLVALVTSVLSLCAICGEPVRLPKDGGILDVTQSRFGAVPNDGRDDTKATQSAVEAYPSGNRIVFLPPGEYIVTDTLRWGGTSSGNAQKRTILQGAGRGLSTIRLPERTSGFAEEKPKTLIWTGRRPAQRFRNAVRDLTVEI